VADWGLWVGTFHGIAHRLLRMHYREANLPENFQILDSDDQLRLVRRVLKDLELEEARWPSRRAQWYINSCKDDGQRAADINPGDDPIAQQWLNIYQAYESQCQRSGLVDFAEILLRAHELWLKNPELLEHYQHRFRHILVDEFQDTNRIQYAWIRVLAGDQGCVFVVGDDDQSIYGWRGARVENVQHFTQHFKQVKTLRLEQNYRSSGIILKAANEIIKNNEGRMGKNLWTEHAEGEPIQLYAAYNEQDEARFVVDRIQQWLNDGRALNDSAILYRSNAQSRQFEELLVARRIPYRVYGGQRFFERAEIKDALAYLRLVSNPHDDPGFERVVNVPARGIGERTLDQLRRQASQNQCSLWQAGHELIQSQGLAARAARAVSQFFTLIESMAQSCDNASLEEQMSQVIRASDLMSHYEKEPPDRAEARKDNLEELINAAKTFAIPEEDLDAGMDELGSFLSHAALEAGEAQADAWEDCVQMMTLHSAKGLEFPLVFLCGLEEGLFPHQRSAEEPGRMEEERRLCYVGVTRARELLYISFAESRRWRGSETFNRPSRFVGEIPKQLVHDIRPKVEVTRHPAMRPLSGQIPVEAPAGLQLGQSVRHAKFGLGVVMDSEGSGAHTRVQVNFEQAGVKWLVLAYANLELL